MSGLPKGWAPTKIRGLIALKYGKALPDRERSGEGFPVYGSNGVVGAHHTALTTDTTIIIGRKGSVGEVNYSEGPCSPIDTTYFVESCPGEQARFWYYKLRSLSLGSLNKSTAIPGVSREDVYDLDISLPPIPEQKRIADKLDSTLARVEACRDRLDRLPGLLKRFRQSILAAATSGRLTEDWRATRSPDEAQRNPGVATDLNADAAELPGWTPQTIGSLCESSFYGPRFGKGEYTSSDAGIPTIRTTDMTDDGRIEVTESTPRVSVPANRLEDFKVRRGDLLVTRTGSIGVMAVFDEDYLAIPSAYLIRFRFKAAIVPRYAFFCLMAPRGQEALGLSSTAITQPNVNAEAIKRIGINLPQIEEQHEIVRRVETLFAFADRLEARLATARKQAEQLTPALLAKAFRGELVPQDPKDEPATELLKRLATTRAETPKAKRGRKAAA